MTCTAIDHCYPQNAPDRKTAAGTPCYCGRRTWGGGKRRVVRPAQVGDVVKVLGYADAGERYVAERVRDDGQWLYKVDGAPVRGRLLFERSELEVVR